MKPVAFRGTSLEALRKVPQQTSKTDIELARKRFKNLMREQS